MITPNPARKIVFHTVMDVLYVDWSEFTEEALSRSSLTLDTVLETIRNHNVRYLLTDTRKAKVGFPEQHQKDLVQNFAVDLAKSSIKKIARVVTADALGQQQANDANQKCHFPFPVKSFDNVKDGLEWLTSDK